MDVEAVIHRIGGADMEGPRIYGPWVRPIGLDSRERFEVPASDASRYWLTLWLADWTPTDPDWMSCRLELESMNGQIFGRRPALLYAQPFDVPTYTSFKTPYAELGLFSVGLRVSSR